MKSVSPHNLYRGQEQQVAISAILASGNDILTLDEPISELGEHAMKRIVAILSDLKKQGKTTLIIEHKYAHFKDLVVTLVVMENGVIRPIGTPEDVLADDRIRKIVVGDFSVYCLHKNKISPGKNRMVF